ncbi:hypothetical protein E7681_10290 [Thalassobius vesicularis]|uniref:Uncharacterized protein n=1 Tax=Thalassobius vesicularis TaxID=1294297 RepID=A0A4V3UZ13_9RHOB|nr:DUF5665 domain-containing protein [Thalassobius vesicularis]THD73987.1 hypothetical protein E7681_10290 [Thalassobius vesicularis]
MTQPPPQDDTLAALHQLTKELKVLNSHRFITVQNSVIRGVVFQFVRGLAFGLGSVLGATLLVSIITWWLSHLDFLPIIGDWLVQLANEFERAASGQPAINQTTQ